MTRCDLSAGTNSAATAAVLAVLTFGLGPLGAQTITPATSPATTSSAPTSPKRLTLEAIFGPDGVVDFDGSYATGLTWIPDGAFLDRRDGRLMRIDPATDAATPAYDRDRLRAALVAAAIDEKAADRLADRPGRFTEDRRGVLIEHERRLLYYRFDSGKLTPLLGAEPARRAVTLSPSGVFVSFVQNHDLHVVSTADARVRRLTRDGGATKLNGQLDWVYMEEVYGRGQEAAHWWRPDEQAIAFLQFDESGVPEYTIVDAVRRPTQVEKTFYPKAGDPNPRVRLGVCWLATGRITWIDLSPYERGEFLIVRVGWNSEGRLIYQVQDREQRWLHLNDADPQSGRFRTLVSEYSAAWVNVLDDPEWLSDGTFLWRSERDGWAHLYHYRRDGILLNRLTRGAWDVQAVHGVDPAGGWVYFSGSRDSSIERHVYRIPLAGGEPLRLTEQGFSHSASFDPACAYFIDTFSNAATPPRVHLRRADGTLVRVISANDVAALREYRLSRPEFLTVPARDGARLNAMLIRPPDFVPGRSYPVWSNVYGGPQSQSVFNRWGGRGAMLNQYMAQEGFLVWVCDPRASSGHGAAGAWQSYKRLGEQEVADLEDGARWLIDHASADPDRIGIYGHSYGGFMTAYVMTHSRMFSVGVAGSSVLDWRNYDSIYTERYMQTPQNNPDGYERTSVVGAAKNLHGRLLVYHGALDDNVHMQNTLQFISELQKHNRTFDLMVYPQDRHGIGAGQRHLREAQLRYAEEHLLRR